MGLVEWLNLARRESHKDLHEFNAKFEADFASSCDEIMALRAGFEAYLGAAPTPRVSEPAAQLLLDYCSVDRVGPDGSNCLPAFQGPKVRVGDRELSTLKSFAGVEVILTKRPRLKPGIDKIKAWIRRAPNLAPVTGNAIETRDRQDKLDTWVEELSTAAKALEEVSPPLAARRRLPPAGRVRSRGLRRASSGSEKTILWLTFSEAIDELMKGRRFFTKAGRTVLSPAARSFLVARRRYLTGLFYPDGDTLADLDYFSQISPPTAYRVYFDLRLLLGDHGKDRVCQPTMFSQGDKCLFISAPPDATNGGKTVRLARTECRHVDRRCKCFKTGLDEVVMPQSVAENAPVLRVAEVAIALGRYLRVYRGAGYRGRPGVPDGETLDTVRAQKTAERGGSMKDELVR